MLISYVKLDHALYLINYGTKFCELNDIGSTNINVLYYVEGTKFVFLGQSAEMSNISTCRNTKH